MQAPKLYRWLLGGLVLAPLATVMVGVRPGIADRLSQERQEKLESHSVKTIGPTAEITETISGLSFVARVDTGAAVTSLHCTPDDCFIEGASEDPWQNLGKPVRLRVENRQGVQAWIDTQIEDYVEVRSANGAEHRYRIRLPLRFGNVMKETIVNLNDRSAMSFRMLLGRDFLAGDFVVDVAMADVPSS